MEYQDAINSTGVLVHGWVQEPNGRGTFGILWSCVAVLFLNTWTVLHLNIPPKDRNAWRKFLHKVKWWIICAMVPDGLCVNAFSQWRVARKSVPLMRKHYRWWTLKHGFYAEMGGYKVQDKVTKQIYHFRAVELEYLTRHHLIKLPEITVEEIDDKSNADGLAKGLAIVQSTWFLFQTIARAIQHLPLTTLELATTAFIGCTWLTYGFWWHKPLELDTDITVEAPLLDVPQLCNLAQATCFGEARSEWYRPPPRHRHARRWDYFWWEKPMVLKDMEVVDTSRSIPSDLRSVVETNFTALGRVMDWYMPFVNETHASEWGGFEHFVVWLIGVLFNGVHLCAWSFVFPSHVESIMWKVAVIGMLTYTTLWIPVAYLLRPLPNTSFAKNLEYWIITLLYFLTRLYLLVEIFVGLRAVNPCVFLTVDWTEYIPHI